METGQNINFEDVAGAVSGILSDYEAYFNHCLKIVEFGTKALIPFHLNPVQKILHNIAENQREEHEHIRVIVLKARRFGISTYIQGRFFKNCASEYNKTVHICTQDRSTTDKMFMMTRIMEQNLPEYFKPEVKYTGKRELMWDNDAGTGLKSMYGLSSVGGAEVRGDAIDYLHCSEVSSWGPNGAEYALGLMNCVVSGYNTEVWLESTAKGVGGFFYDEFFRAWEGRSGFKAIFFPWFIFDEYHREFSDEEEKDNFINSLGDDERYGGKEEVSLLGYSTSYETADGDLEFEITAEHLKWRRLCIDTQCQGNLDQFHQEYPTTARGAFISSGRSVFDASKLAQWALNCEDEYRLDPPEKYEVPVNIQKTSMDAGYRESVMDYHLLGDKHGRLTVWKSPTSGREYRIGADVSEGLEINRDTDYSVATVVDAETLEEAATWRGRIDPDLFAWVLASLGKWYNEALIGVERNNHGMTTLTFLKNIHQYSNMFMEKTVDERSMRSTKKMGWGTTSKTKPLMIDHLRELIREDEVSLHTKEIIDELQTFVHFADGKMGSQHGSHDDCVIALAITLQLCRMHPPSYHYMDFEDEDEHYSTYTSLNY